MCLRFTLTKTFHDPLATTKTYTLKKAMIAAMQETLGIVKRAAEFVASSYDDVDEKTLRTTHYKWIREDNEYRANIDDIDYEVVDFGKSALFKKVEEGDTASIIFLMKTKGAKAGFVEQRHLDVTSQGEQVSISPIKWTDGSGQD